MYPYIQGAAVASIIIIIFHYFSKESRETLNELEHH